VYYTLFAWLRARAVAWLTLRLNLPIEAEGGFDLANVKKGMAAGLVIFYYLFI
jgi:hypothetical protein